MKNILLFLSAAMLTFGCGSSKINSPATITMDNALTEAEKNDGWELLFDGQSLDKWHTYGKSTLQPGWKTEDGALYLDTEGTENAGGKRENNNIITNDSYSNFHLQIDWKISPKGNSGIILYVEEDAAQYPENYNTGMEMQILDNGTPTRLGHPDSKIYSHRAGDLYDLLASLEGAVSLQGEWNHVEVKSENGTLDFYMNGTHTLSTTLWDDHWREMIAISKFKDMKTFGTFKQGKISLQDHGDLVHFKNIKIKKL